MNALARLTLLTVTLAYSANVTPKDSEVTFTALTDKDFRSRRTPAEATVIPLPSDSSPPAQRLVVKIHTLEMLEEDYAQIGFVEYEGIVATCKRESRDAEKCEELKDDPKLEKLQDTAASAGGDRILVYRDGEPTPRLRVSSKCVSWNDNVGYRYVYDYSTKSMQLRHGSLGRSCKEYAAVPENVIDIVQAYRADVYRLDPEFADIQRNGIRYEIAIAENKAALLEALLDQGIPVDSPTLNGLVPITLAAHYGNVEAASTLLKRGADINHLTLFGTPLHLAAANGDARFVEFLLANGADIDLSNPYEEQARKGMNALHYAATGGNAEVILALAEAGLDVNSTSDMGATPLMLASRADQAEAAQTLITLGANVNQVLSSDINGDGEATRFSALMFAVVSDAANAARILLESGADPNTELTVKKDPRRTNERNKSSTVYDYAKRSASKGEGIEVYLLLARNVEGVYGFIDEEGAVVIEPQYDFAHPFSEGLALVGTRTGLDEYRYGYIDRDGTVAIQLQFDIAGSFSDGLAPAGRRSDDPENRRDKTYGYIDRKGEFVIDPRYDYANGFIDGIALVTLASGNRHMYIDAEGRNICGELTFALGDDFSNGWARVISDFGTPPRYIDRKCDFMPITNLTAGNSFSEGFAAVRIGEKWGYLDTDGTVVILPRFVWADDFDGGLAAVRVKKLTGRSLGFVDKTGELVIQPEYTWVNPFRDFGTHSGQFAEVSRGSEDDAFWIDREGNVVEDDEPLAAIQRGYYRPGWKVVDSWDGRAFLFSEGLAHVRIK